MTFFSGFSLRDEAHFFSAFSKEGDYCVAGFSYGAVRAFEYASAASRRVDTLQLFSPAFFQCKPERYKRLQMTAFRKDPDAYASQFIMNCFAPYDVRAVSQSAGTPEELETLLQYVWQPDRLAALAAKGTKIEVYLGGLDRIIDADKAREFFTPYATVTYVAHANHFLQEQ